MRAAEVTRGGGALAAGTVAALGVGVLCQVAGTWLSTGVLALALMISSWTVMFAAAKSQGEEPLIVPLVGWMIAGSAVYATFATSLLPWGTNLAPALNTLTWAAGFHAGVPVAAVSAYLWPDFRRPARQTRG